jgi:hypothetical protein
VFREIQADKDSGQSFSESWTGLPSEHPGQSMIDFLGFGFHFDQILQMPPVFDRVHGRKKLECNLVEAIQKLNR